MDLQGRLLKLSALLEISERRAHLSERFLSAGAKIALLLPRSRDSKFLVFHRLEHLEKSALVSLRHEAIYSSAKWRDLRWPLKYIDWFYRVVCLFFRDVPG